MSTDLTLDNVLAMHDRGGVMACIAADVDHSVQSSM